jgi:hypothetical protein
VGPTGLLVGVVCAGMAQPEPPDWRRGDEYFSDDLRDWETIYPDTVMGASDEAAEGFLSVQVVSDGAEHLGLCRRLPDLDLEFETIRHVACYVRCSEPSNGYIRLGTGPSPWFDHWGFSNLRFATDRWTRIDLLPLERKLYVDGVFHRAPEVSDGTFEPTLCQYLAVFNTYGQEAGDFMLVDGVDLAPSGPWWACSEHGAELYADLPSDPRGPYNGRLVARRGGPLLLGLRDTVEQFAAARKLQLLAKTSKRAQVQLLLGSGRSSDDKLVSELWEQERDRYVLVEYVPGADVVRVDGREVRCMPRNAFRPDQIDQISIAWLRGCALDDVLTVEGLVFVPKGAAEVGGG